MTEEKIALEITESKAEILYEEWESWWRQAWTNKAHRAGISPAQVLEREDDDDRS